MVRGHAPAVSRFARRPEMPLNFVIEFYRQREADEAHAMLDRVSLEAPNLRAAWEAAGSLFHTLAMPQIPDGVRICDEEGAELYAGPADGAYPA